MARNLKLTLLIPILLLLSGCFANVGSDISAVTSPDDSTTEANDLTLSNFSISNTSSTGFDVSFDSVGDTNDNADVKIYVCSIKAQAACNPTSGSSVSLTKSNSQFSASVVLASLGLTAGDVVKYKIVASDTDGFTGSESEGFLIIPHDASETKTISQLGFINLGRKIDSSGSDRVVSSTIDSSGNIYLAGNTNGHLGEVNAGGTDVFVMKILPSGELDTSFNGTGIKQLGSFSVGSGASGNDEISSLVLDASGNIYIAGGTTGSLGEVNAGSTDAFIAKILPTGGLDTSFNSTGIKQLGNVSVGAGANNLDYFSAISFDASGNIYLAGSTMSTLGEANAGIHDAFVVKILANGNLDTTFNSTGIKQIGSVTIGSAASGFELVSVMSIDSSGSIYIGGLTNSSLGETAGGNDAFIIKLLSTGSLDTSFNTTGIKQLGTVSLGVGANGSDDISSMSIDASGNIFIAGYTGALGETNAGGNDAYVAKILPTGSFDTSFNSTGIKQLGNLSVGAGASGSETVKAMSIDSSGNIYLAGYTTGALGEANGGGNDAFVTKLLPSGNLDTSFNSTGIRQVGSASASLGQDVSGSENIYGMVLDPTGNIYLAGYTDGSLGEANAGSNDVLVLKILPSGSLDTSFNSTGIKQFGKVTVGVGASGDDSFNAASVDASGNVYLAGSTGGSLGELNAGGTDGFVAKFLPNGNLDTSFNGTGIKQLGNVTVGSGASADETITSIALDASGNIYLAGKTEGDLGETKSGLGDAFVVKLLPTGSLDTSFNTIGIKQLGNVSVGASASNSETLMAMILDDTGNIFITGETQGSLDETTAGGSDVYLAKILPNGSLDTSFSSNGIKQFGNVSVGFRASSTDAPSAICLDSSGNIYIGGITSGTLGEANAGQVDAFVAKLTSSGAIDTSFNSTGFKQLGNVSVGAGASGIEFPWAIALDASENIYISGVTSGSLGEANAGNFDVFVAKILPTGSLDTSFSTTGIKQLGNVSVGAAANGADYVTKIILDSSENIYLAGYTSGSLGETKAWGYDAILVKLLPTGALDTSFDSTGIKQFGDLTVGSSADGDEFINTMTMDASGNIYLGGITTGSLVEKNAGGQDAILIKVEP